MRTRAKGKYCLTAIALGASVRLSAHFFAMKALSSGCADCVLARKDAQTFDNQADMSKEAVRPDCECRRRMRAISDCPHTAFME